MTISAAGATSTFTTTTTTTTTITTSTTSTTLLRCRIEDERDAESVGLPGESRHFAEKVKVGFAGQRLHFGGVGRLTRQDFVEVESELGEQGSWEGKRQDDGSCC